MSVETPFLQLIAYTSLTAASVIVSFASTFMAWRQNRGWRPVILVNATRIQIAKGRSYVSIVECEFWNRQKYPVTIRQIGAEYKTMKFNNATDQGLGDGWISDSMHKLVDRTHRPVESNAHYKFETRMPFELTNDDDFQEWPMIGLYYFDPVQSRMRKLELDMDADWTTGPDIYRANWPDAIAASWKRFSMRMWQR